MRNLRMVLELIDEGDLFIPFHSIDSISSLYRRAGSLLVTKAGYEYEVKASPKEIMKLLKQD